MKKSSGQFIFASTVAKYVNSYRHWPPDRLKIIFEQSKPCEDSNTPFSELDELYRFILSSATDIDKVKDILVIIVLRPFLPYRLMTNLVERFLFYRPGEVNMILSELHSIISVRDLHFFHASLPDFLLARSRSMNLFLDQGIAYAKFTSLAVKHINNPTESPLGNDQCTPSPCYDFVDSMKMKTMFIAYFSFVVSRLIHPQSSLRTCAG